MANEGHVASDKIVVYPCGRRDGAVDPASRLTTEFNIVNLINRLTDQDGFVMLFDGGEDSISVDSYDEDYSFSTDYVSFSLGGYLFTVSVNSLLSLFSVNENFTIYAHITLTSWGGEYNTASNVVYQDLNEAGTQSGLPSSLDSEGKFLGVCFTNNATLENETKKLPILEVIKDGSKITCTIPADSLLKFTTNATHRSISIDDGDLDVGVQS